MVTLEELKKHIAGINRPIDRIAGFCDGYAGMLTHCSIKVKDETSEVIIDTSDTHDLECPETVAVSEAIATLLALPSRCDDYAIVYVGFDDNNSITILGRDVCSIGTVESPEGTGLSFRGMQAGYDLFEREERPLYLTRILIEDKRAQGLNHSFYLFVEEVISPFGDHLFVNTSRGNVYIRMVSEKLQSEMLVALLAGTFNGVLFSRLELTLDAEAESVTNDRSQSPYQAIYYKADTRDLYSECKLNWFEFLEDVAFLAADCDSDEDVRQFFMDNKVDHTVGDVAQRVVTRYINDPLNFILGDDDECEC